MSNSSEKRLEEIRKRINEIDEQLIELIAERTSFAPEIAALKKSLGTCVFDPKREDAICEKTRLMCEKHHIEPEVALKVMKILMTYNKEVQKDSIEG
ncbi:chorismate mutase [Methanococcus maripaludis]|uniref:Chorismate mutase n=1 Tax=Methanococcus maripaludis TaxID=39152 RepID=A0A2L1C8Z8_METMI|nr:chorismate mutase [Methanococcus maripaludis]AVB75824.1 chorismate mutase [Methanococcus maripaludis]MBA2853653.1 chorismate mutase [Methanococcus maripaludis]MBA2864240.1 chorismate mutase [Methanococcus maripaludis]MBA2869633.1 chorismate mutase [Methanococcus maripaludis]MBB6402278.1 chorismate mutase [Methanococcus maripaludis]